MTAPIPKDDLLEELKRLQQELGRSPSMSDMSDHGKYSPKAYQNAFSTWNEAKERVGLETTEPAATYSDGELLDQLREVANDIGKTPTSQQMDEYPNSPNPVTYKDRFGTWNQAVRKSGLEPNQRGRIVDEPRKEQLLGKIQELAEEIDRADAPTAREMDQMSKTEDSWPCQSTIRNVFGSWRAGVKAAGYSPYDQGRSPEHTDPEIEIDYVPVGKNWFDQREKAIKRDGEACIDCGKSREKHREEHEGRDLLVHHLIPRRRFYDDDRVTVSNEGNQLKNLVTLCFEHHKKWENREVSSGEIGIELPDDF